MAKRPEDECANFHLSLQTHTCAHTQTHTLTHTNTYTQIHIHTETRSATHTDTHSCTHTVPVNPPWCVSRWDSEDDEWEGRAGAMESKRRDKRFGRNKGKTKKVGATLSPGAVWV